jgi:hypothetical protein
VALTLPADPGLTGVGGDWLRLAARLVAARLAGVRLAELMPGDSAAWGMGPRAPVLAGRRADGIPGTAADGGDGWRRLAGESAPEGERANLQTVHSRPVERAAKVRQMRGRREANTIAHPPATFSPVQGIPEKRKTVRFHPLPSPALAGHESCHNGSGGIFSPVSAGSRTTAVEGFFLKTFFLKSEGRRPVGGRRPEPLRTTVRPVALWPAV